GAGGRGGGGGAELCVTAQQGDRDLVDPHPAPPGHPRVRELVQEHRAEQQQHGDGCDQVGLRSEPWLERAHRGRPQDGENHGSQQPPGRHDDGCAGRTADHPAPGGPGPAFLAHPITLWCPVAAGVRGSTYPAPVPVPPSPQPTTTPPITTQPATTQPTGSAATTGPEPTAGTACSSPEDGATPRRRPGLSPSRAKDFMQCPLLFRFRVVDRLPEPPSAAAVRGTLVHSVLEKLFDEPAGRRTLPAAVALVGPAWQELVT